MPDLGPVRRIFSGPRRQLRHLAALSHRASTTSTSCDPPPCDAPHLTPRAGPQRSAGQGLDRQVAYWDAVAAAKTFTHPLHLPWLAEVDRHAAVLDYGCGYGRTLAELQSQGFDDLTGVDTSPAMIARGRRAHPGIRFEELESPPRLAAPDAGFDVAVLFAVLTCVPSDAAQYALVTELARLLKPGGLLYVSDLLLQDDARNRARYARFAERYGTYGVFETSDGAVCRHHAADRFPSLLADWDLLDTRHTVVSTMNGNEAVGIQLLARAPRSPDTCRRAEVG